MVRESKFYWLKSDGSVEEISREQCLKLEKTNHRIIWSDGKSINFIGHISSYWFPIEQIKKVINYVKKSLYPDFWMPDKSIIRCQFYLS